MVLPCVIDMAYPPPLFHWTHIVPHKDVVPNRFQQLSNGSLLVTGVKIPAIYQCIAWNEYGTSIQITYLSKCGNIDCITVILCCEYTLPTD